jgi:hypothetical protein
MRRFESIPEAQFYDEANLENTVGREIHPL